jgi:repressor LexA
VKPPTARQGEVLAFFAAFAAEHGYPPTLRELARHLGVTSSNGASDHVRLLIRKGYLQRPLGLKSRSCTLTEAGLDWLATRPSKARVRVA